MTQLAATRSGSIVEPLRYSRIYRATETYETAVADDPIKQYVQKAPDAEPPNAKQFKARVKLHAFVIALLKHRKWVYGIGNVQSVVIASPVRNGLLDRFFAWLLTWFVARSDKGLLGEKAKRIAEARSKVKAAVERGVGSRAKEMIYIDGLATHPAHQGKGYGGMLLGTVTAKADSLGQAAYLVSSNTENTRFYEKLGFSTVAEAVLGDDNPTWDEAPIVVKTMVREPRPVGLGEVTSKKNL